MKIGVTLARSQPRWEDERAGQKDMRKEKEREEGLGRGRVSFFPTHTHLLLPTITLSSLRLAGNGIVVTTGKAQGSLSASAGGVG